MNTEDGMESGVQSNVTSALTPSPTPSRPGQGQVQRNGLQGVRQRRKLVRAGVRLRAVRPARGDDGERFKELPRHVYGGKGRRVVGELYDQ
jgi:hypothetical protein